ncbi:uncharacterized protein LOC127083763 [Lathyrus oleraceus]|uniref:uncharacterized protein LOC127083763 n=1 Tax=Pisum sativum TaxID=3888 RepID=UPI0021D301D9|nr:uncharacterized protein LOC127083763 [Pisum sativum]
MYFVLIRRKMTPTRKWVGDVRYFYGTLKFRLFNQKHDLYVEYMRSILLLPIFGPVDVPDDSLVAQFWAEITGKIKSDMEALIHQGMIVVVGNTYSVMIYNQHLIDLPDPDIVMLWIKTLHPHTSALPNKKPGLLV